jgi:hypothetical protein
VQLWHANEPALDWQMILTRFSPKAISLEDKIRGLGLINCFQWHLEDACRSNYSSIEILARLKYEIDSSNDRRVKMIDEIDYVIFTYLLQLRPDTQNIRPTLITPGNLIDRLSILELKLYHSFGQSYGSRSTSSNRVAELLEDQIQDVRHGIDELISDLSAGRLRLKFYRMVKVYSPTQPNIHDL